MNKLGLGIRFDQERELFSMVFFSYFLILLFPLVVILLHTSGEELLPVSYRYHGLILLGVVLLILMRFRLYTIAKVLILTVVPFLLLILPILAGIVSDEFYFWFPYVPIALSLPPHFILHTKRERAALLVTLVAYLLLSIFMSHFMILFSDGSETIIPIVQANRFYYDLIPTIIYLFVNLALGLVFARNYQYEQIMIRQQDELIQAEKMGSLGVMTTGIAHEINNPMNFISGGIHATSTLKSELLKLEGTPSKKKLELYEQMDKIMENSLEGVQRVTDIVASLKFFANPGKAIKKDHDLNHLFYSVLQSLEKKIPSSITLNKRIPDGMTIYCYDEQMQQVFIHILLNAIQVLEESKDDRAKIIDISAAESRKEGQELTSISISNNGPPIPEQELKKIYDPFYTIDKSGTGKGLGMAISYMIIREHKGWIEARNENDLVIFDVILPRA
jgi:signal transduction histidine kinase